MIRGRSGPGTSRVRTIAARPAASCPGRAAAIVLGLPLLLASALATCSPARGTDPTGSPNPEPGAQATLHRLRDNGIRCVTFPCFSVDATPLDEPTRTVSVSNVDFQPLDPSPALLDSLLARLADPEGLVAGGRIELVPDAGPAGDGRVFRVTRLPSA